jgi:hypothetical protein
MSIIFYIKVDNVLDDHFPSVIAFGLTRVRHRPSMGTLAAQQHQPNHSNQHRQVPPFLYFHLFLQMFVDRGSGVRV